MRISFFLAAFGAMMAFAPAARADLQILAGPSASFQGTGTTPFDAQIGNGSDGTLTVTGANASATTTYIHSPIGILSPDTNLHVQNGQFTLGDGTRVSYNVNLDSNTPGVSGNATILGNATSLTVSNLGSASETVTFQLSSNGFNTANFPSGAPLYLTNSLSSLGGVLGDSITLTSVIDGQGHLTAQGGDNITAGVPLSLSLPATGAQVDGSLIVPYSSLMPGPFSLIETITVHIAANSSIQINTQTSVTPEPASLLAWGCGLGVIGLVRHRRRKAVIA